MHVIHPLFLLLLFLLFTVFSSWLSQCSLHYTGNPLSSISPLLFWFISSHLLLSPSFTNLVILQTRGTFTRIPHSFNTKTGNNNNGSKYNWRVFGVSTDGFMSLMSSSSSVFSTSVGSGPPDSREGEVCSWAPTHEETGGCGSGTETHSYHW